MKKCTKCGATNDNLYTSCIDCGAPLGPPLSKEELKEAEKAGLRKSKETVTQSEYFYVSKADQTVAILLITGAVLQLLMVSRINQSKLVDYIIILWIVIVWMLVEAISLLFPKLAWSLVQLGIPRRGEGSEKQQPTEVTVYLRRGIAYSMVFVGYALIVIICLYLYL